MNSKIMRALADSTDYVDDFSGFNFSQVAGGLYTFQCFRGTGYCYKRPDDRFKYARAILKEDI